MAMAVPREPFFSFPWDQDSKTSISGRNSIHWHFSLFVLASHGDAFFWEMSWVEAAIQRKKKKGGGGETQTNQKNPNFETPHSEGIAL